VTAARVSQSERFKGTRLLTNADMGSAEVRRFCQLSARAYHRVLKLVRTITDLADVLGFRLAYLREALSY